MRSTRKRSRATSILSSTKQDEDLKTVLGNCQPVVNYLGAIRNKIGDAQIGNAPFHYRPPNLIDEFCMTPRSISLGVHVALLEIDKSENAK
jgi:hypothetical protein